VEDFKKNERSKGPRRCNQNSADEGVAGEGDLPNAREGLLQIEMYQELLVLSQGVPFARTKGGLQGDGRLQVRVQMQDAMIWIGGRCWRFPGARIDTGSWETEWRNDGKMLLHDDTGAVIEGIEVPEPEDAGTAPSPEERRFREVNLARLMLVIVDIVLTGDPLGLETARDLVREVRHACPELVDKYL
jgi:hypothetical protein